MAVALDATSGSSTASASSVTLSHTCAASAVLYVVVFSSPSSTISSVTYNAVAMTRIGVTTGGNDFTIYEVWRLAAPTSGAHNILVTMGASTAEIDVMGLSVTGAAGTESDLTNITAISFDGTFTYTHTVASAVGDLAFSTIGMNMGISSGIAVTVGTQRQVQPAVNKSVVLATNTGAATTTFTYTASSGWSIGRISFSINQTVVASTARRLGLLGVG